MGHIEVGLLVYTCQIDLTRSEMAGSWTLRIGEVIDTGAILVMVLTGIMIAIVIILTGGVIGDIFRMSSRNPSHLNMMEK